CRFVSADGVRVPGGNDGERDLPDLEHRVLDDLARPAPRRLDLLIADREWSLARYLHARSAGRTADHCLPQLLVADAALLGRPVRQRDTGQVGLPLGEVLPDRAHLRDERVQGGQIGPATFGLVCRTEGVEASPRTGDRLLDALECLPRLAGPSV